MTSAGIRVAVIPARGGSKRIPGKNIRPFAGRPIIAYSIAAARDCGLFDRVIVSTDSPEIAALARDHGAETPFLRPAELADDFCGTNAVVAHALARLAEAGEAVELACCLYATAPLIRPDDLRRGLAMMADPAVAFAFSATEYAFPIQRALRLSASGAVGMFQPDALMLRSQDLEPAYHDAAQFYWGRSFAFTQNVPIFGSHARLVMIPRYRVMDIDTPEDWLHAELLYAALQRTA